MVNKDEANYRISDNGQQRCGTCSMFQAPGSCSLVTGAITPVGVCDYWEPVNTGGGGRVKDWVDPAGGEALGRSHEMATAIGVGSSNTARITWSEWVKEELAATASTPEGAKVVLPYWKGRRVGKVELSPPITDTEKQIHKRSAGPDLGPEDGA